MSASLNKRTGQERMSELVYKAGIEVGRVDLMQPHTRKKRLRSAKVRSHSYRGAVVKKKS